MAQLFHPSLNTFSRLSIFGAVFALAGLGWLGDRFYSSSYVTEVGVVRPQPVQFSHAHHVGDVGLDCRYCHQSVETGAFAGIPATQVCMGCHSQIFKDAPILEPVRASFRDHTPLRWTRVHQLEEFAYFNHSIHIAKGVGCSTCHGRVDEMPQMWKTETLYMQWCLHCHRHPERFVRPKDQVFNMAWTPPADQEEQGRKLVEEYGIGRSSPPREKVPADSSRNANSPSSSSGDPGKHPTPLESLKDANGKEKYRFEDVLTNCSVCHR